MNPNAQAKSALSFYKVSSNITGVFLILVGLEMLFKYAFGLLIWSGGSAGVIGLVPDAVDGTGLPIEGVDISKLLLQIHGILYVVYLFADFRVWRMANMEFKDFLIIAMGGVLPLSAFFIERNYQAKFVKVFGLEKTGV
jgi:integral membrane protein